MDQNQVDKKKGTKNKASEDESDLSSLSESSRQSDE